MFSGAVLLAALTIAFSAPQDQHRVVLHRLSAQSALVRRTELKAPTQHEQFCPTCLPKSPEAEMKDAIQEFLGKNIISLNQEIAAFGGQRVDILIVTVPDPVQTHLSLFFDRSMDALQQALTRQGYLFAGAALPWDSKQHTEADDWQIRQGQIDWEHAREEMPGLLIYRRPPDQTTPSSKPLFVLLVGETPTTGIHKDQFTKALALCNSWLGDPDGKARKRLRILGPTFSGSLYSMVEILKDDRNLKTYDVYLDREAELESYLRQSRN